MLAIILGFVAQLVGAILQVLVTVPHTTTEVKNVPGPLPVIPTTVPDLLARYGNLPQ